MKGRGECRSNVLVVDEAGTRLVLFRVKVDSARGYGNKAGYVLNLDLSNKSIGSGDIGHSVIQRSLLAKVLPTISHYCHLPADHPKSLPFSS